MKCISWTDKKDTINLCYLEFSPIFPLHCVHFREKLEQKRFSAKLRIEPGTIRLPTVGCFNHSATGLVGKWKHSLKS